MLRRILKGIIVFFTRSWEDEPGYTPPQLRRYPPFVYDLFGFTIATLLLIAILSYLYGLF